MSSNLPGVHVDRSLKATGPLNNDFVIYMWEPHLPLTNDVIAGEESEFRPNDLRALSAAG